MKIPFASRIPPARDEDDKTYEIMRKTIEHQFKMHPKMTPDRPENGPKRDPGAQEIGKKGGPPKKSEGSLSRRPIFDENFAQRRAWERS